MYSYCTVPLQTLYGMNLGWRENLSKLNTCDHCKTGSTTTLGNQSGFFKDWGNHKQSNFSRTIQNRMDKKKIFIHTFFNYITFLSLFVKDMSGNFTWSYSDKVKGLDSKKQSCKDYLLPTARAVALHWSCRKPTTPCLVYMHFATENVK